MSSKKQLLDPLGTMCKIILLNFTELNTKISIQNHVLTLHRPYNYQFIIRMMNGDGRENISELFYVIIRIIKWYMVDPHSLIFPHIQKIVEYACVALSRLQETYAYGNVVLAIQFYINILH